MSIRITIAKWLAPELAKDLEESEYEHRKTRIERNRFMVALHHVVMLRTPKCAHIGKRMADIAEAALSHSQAPSPSTPTPEREAD